VPVAWLAACPEATIGVDWADQAGWRPSLSAVNKAVDGGAFLTAPATVDDNRYYTFTMQVCTINWQLSVCVLKTPGDDG